MADYPFYRGAYRGDSIPQEEFPRLAARAEAQLARYKRMYRVAAPDGNAEDMALCAMADALYFFEQAQGGGSVSIGSVTESRPALSPREQAAELYRSAGLYLRMYRGVTG